MPAPWPLVGRCTDGRLSLRQLEEVYEHDREISFRTFARKVNVAELSALLGYAFGRHAKGLRLSKDWHVRFHRSKLNGRSCLHMEWSAIDHVFQSPAPQ